MQQCSAYRAIEAAQISHQLPVLVCGQRQPGADLGVGVAEVAEGAIQDHVRAALDDQRIDA